jgi:hypothetical protein
MRLRYSINTCRIMCILEKEREHIWSIWSRVTWLTLPLAAAQSLERRALRDSRRIVMFLFVVQWIWTWIYNKWILMHMSHCAGAFKTMHYIVCIRRFNNFPCIHGCNIMIPPSHVTCGEDLHNHNGGNLGRCNINLIAKLRLMKKHKYLKQ